MRRAAHAILIVALTACSGARAASGDSAGAATSSAIRAARERFNAAIASRDTATIASLFLPTYHLISGRSAQSHGVAEEIAVWTSMFAPITRP